MRGNKSPTLCGPQARARDVESPRRGSIAEGQGASGSQEIAKSAVSARRKFKQLIGQEAWYQWQILEVRHCARVLVQEPNSFVVQVHEVGCHAEQR